MTRTMRRRLLLPALALTLAAAAPAGAQMDQGQATTEPYIPFVTDFGRTSFSTPPSQLAPATAEAKASGLDWSDAAIGAALGFGLAAGLGAAGAAVVARRGAWRSSPEEARPAGS